MTDRRSFFLGIIVSLAWLVAAAALLWNKRSELGSMSPNAWGDFLAGCFAPLAFLWLVLGYLQQGEELRLNTEALRLQADELKSSVEQQRALVEVSRQQVESERERFKEERQLQLAQAELSRQQVEFERVKFKEDRQRQVAVAKPNIIVEPDGGTYRRDGQSTYPLVFANAGNIALNFFVTLRNQRGRLDVLHKAAVFERGMTHRSQVEVSQPSMIDGSILEINFCDQLGNQYLDRYLIEREVDYMHSSLKVLRIEA